MLLGNGRGDFVHGGLSGPLVVDVLQMPTPAGAGLFTRLRPWRCRRAAYTGDTVVDTRLDYFEMPRLWDTKYARVHPHG